MQCQSRRKSLYGDWTWKCCWVRVVLILNETCTESLMFLTPLDCLSVSSFLLHPHQRLHNVKRLEASSWHSSITSWQYAIIPVCWQLRWQNQFWEKLYNFLENYFGDVASFEEFFVVLWCFLHTSSWTLWLLLSRTFLQHALSFRRYRAFYCSLSHCELKAIKHWLMRSPSARVTGSHLLNEDLLSVISLKL